MTGHMRIFEPVIQQQPSLAEACDGERNETVDISERCSWLSIDISGELGFGRSFELQTSDKNCPRPKRWMLSGISTSNYSINVYMQMLQLKYIGWEKLLLPIVLPKVLRFHRTYSQTLQCQVHPAQLANNMIR
ncbi:uncharacterized protein EI97DRAFT_438549 [Westerdykella ornata]|uniref:Uncharacterized protein n=1 Tax=Westerdykella ornata TaxID=318751 RepID=A0A6A6JZG0_WESOR|nr:uncharacterized protein EI97DRAFT_438549 [Westerdykella ornata]KAF2281156.1 hypothetical protein EI97DRAFT_438549 [Westerdykella ornata]